MEYPVRYSFSGLPFPSAKAHPSAQYRSPASSILLLSFMEIIFAEAEKIRSSCSITASSSRTKPGSTIVSLFRKITYFVVVATMPAFTALQNPVFTEKEIYSTSGKSSATRSNVPSVEPLSITTICVSSFASDFRHFSR